MDELISSELRRIEQRFIDFKEMVSNERLLLDKQFTEYKAFVSAKHAEMNELRRQINDERGQYQTRDKSDAVSNAIQARLTTLDAQYSSLHGRLLGMGLALIFITTLIGLALRFWGK